MSAFRQRKGIFTGGEVPKVNDLRTVDVDVNGVSVSKIVLERVSVDDYHKRHPTIMEDVSLADMLKAGVPIKEMPCSTLLDSKDSLDYPEAENAEEKVLETLQKISKRKTKKVNNNE